MTERDRDGARQKRDRQRDRDRQRERDCSFILKDKGFRQSMSYDLSFLKNKTKQTATTKTEGGDGGGETERVCVEGMGVGGRVSTLPMVSITPRRGYLPLRGRG